MPAPWPDNLKHQYRVCHPMNSRGTTWLCESDLIFLKHKAYAVFTWSRDPKGEHPDQWVELNPKMLKHESGDGPMYRYEGELQDPAG